MPDANGRPTDDDLLNNALPIPADDEDDHDELEPIEVGDLSGGDMDPGEMSSSKIRAFDARKRRAHEDHWERTPNANGTGAIHVKTFIAKLRLDAMDHLDEQVNQWLDAHPEYEVKFVTTSVGVMKTKISEPALIMNVWV